MQVVKKAIGGSILRRRKHEVRVASMVSKTCSLLSDVGNAKWK